MKIRLLLPFLALGIILSGCQPTYREAATNKFIPTNQKAADQLIKKLESRIGSGSTVIISTLADINRLDRSSALGRMVSEQISARFTSAGYHMVELKFGGSVYIPQNNRAGEFTLTRDVEQLAASYNAPAVVVGTYATSERLIFINLKVIQPSTNTVLATHDYALPMNENNKRMLR